jgi:hypothetical protein
MGLNLDLVKMMGLPKKVKCPRCGKKTRTGFDDYDIECNDMASGKPGKLVFAVYCEHCESSSVVLGTVTVDEVA